MYKQYSYNPMVEKIVQILMDKTQNYSPQFFRMQVNFYLSLIPSMMSVKINSQITGKIPVNFYGINLAPSGFGKGMSTNIIEGQVMKHFRNAFMSETFPKYSALSLELTANERSSSGQKTYNETLTELKKEFSGYGKFKFSFDSATAPAIKQIRNLLLLAKTGAINLIIDEIGMNLQNNAEALAALLELYDVGTIKEKLTKNTDTSLRYQELVGCTPANMMLFGTPSKLLNGSKVEEEFFSFLDTGYARRCFFGFSTPVANTNELTPEELFDLMGQQTQDADLRMISEHLHNLADSSLIGSELSLPRDVGIALIDYRQQCEKRASELPEHAEIQRAELVHRYFKVLKLAGTYAFIEGAFNIELRHIQQAIRFAEDSGEALRQIIDREKPYERLAKYIAASKGKELTQVDIQKDLPFYKGSRAAKEELMNMAIAWGYKNNIIIKRSFIDNIEFFTGETLEENDLTKIVLAYSQHFADDYINQEIHWDNLEKLTSHNDYHWINHHSIDGHRSNEKMLAGFNCVVLDIDSGTTISNVQQLMKDYTYFIHTTKRHLVPDENGKTIERFRMVIPMNYKLTLNEEEFKEFMENIANWLPFDGLDVKTFQRSRKWSCYNGIVYKNEGELLDVLPFIPRTKRSEEYKKQQLSLGDLSNLERWYASRMTEGNRNNYLAQYALLLKDSGLSYDSIESTIQNFNNKLANPLPEAEIVATVLTSIKNKM